MFSIVQPSEYGVSPDVICPFLWLLLLEEKILSFGLSRKLWKACIFCDNCHNFHWCCSIHELHDRDHLHHKYCDEFGGLCFAIHVDIFWRFVARQGYHKIDHFEDRCKEVYILLVFVDSFAVYLHSDNLFGRKHVLEHLVGVELHGLYSLLEISLKGLQI